jgi:tetratricopeptide (TPR) repeat protein
MRQFNGYYKSDHNQLHVQIRELLSGAIRLHQNNRLLEAEKRYRRILQVEPNHTEALHLLGVISYQEGHYQQAVELISKAIGNTSNNPIFHNNLGLALEALNQTAASGQSYDKALQIEPRYADAHNNLGNTFKDSGQYEKALDNYGHAIRLKPGFAEAHFNCAMVHRCGSYCLMLQIGVGFWNATTAPGIRPCGCSDNRPEATGTR